MILAPVAGAIAGAVAFPRLGLSLDLLESILRGALTAFGGWALAREIAPDDNPAAFASMALAFLAHLFFPAASVLPLFSTLMLARIVNRSVGVPATPIDSAAVMFLAGWASYSTRQPGPLFVSAIGFGLDAVLSPPLQRQWGFAALSLGAGLAWLISGEISPLSTRGGDIALALPVVALVVAYGLVILFTRKIRSVADRTGEPLSVPRVRAAIALTSLMGIQGALTGAIAPTPSTLIWAVLAGLLLMTIVRPRAIVVAPLFLLALAGCSRAASQSPSPAANAVDTLMDVGGHRLHFKVWPNRSRLTLVFEAGGAAALTSWASVPDTAARQLGLRVVAYDRAGLGSSETGPMDLVPEQESQDLRRSLDRLGANRVVLIGHSYGGLLSVLHALRAPDRVAGLVLVDPMNTDFIQRVTLTWLNTTAPDIANPASPVDTVIVRMKRTIAGLVAAAEPGLASLEMPMVVLTAGVPWWGNAERDAAWRASHETIAGMKANRRLLVATQSRHGIPSTEPGRVIDAIRLLLTLIPEAD
jgi:pimeloyl-ACP methyl ester carboxylesterase